MGISALPDSTVRAIGATQVLTDPAALVKELVDNALDAHATSISVEIHHNTLDTIQVRDNGHGIAPEDRPLVARRYCTSKLSNYDDLKDIGGSSLGFRGEALASAAELSGSLTISTRVEGEQVGASLKINQKGEVVGQDRASLPVGSCVKITAFIKANPVRRQVSLKNADACLKKIKRCLQSYAFARPHVRYSLRVLKAKTAKGDWVYAPKVNGNAEDAAIKLVGSACASQCLWSVLDHEGFSFQAFLPRADADASKIGGFCLFISVDARPVSAARGHFKQIGKAYREGLKSAGTQFEDVKEPFLYLEISCPEDSYDVNVEPAKDDVAFEDPAKVIEGLKKLFAAVYAPTQASLQGEGTGEENPRHRTTTDPRLGDSNSPLGAEGAEISLQAAPVNASRFDNDSNDQQQQWPIEEGTDVGAMLEPRRTVRTNMYGCDEEDLDLLGQQPTPDRTAEDLAERRQARKDISVSNPWVLAKLNSSIRRPDMEQPPDALEGSTFSKNVLGSSPRCNCPPEETNEGMLPTPRASSPSPTSQGFNPSDHVPNIRFARNGNMIGTSRLPPPQMYTPVQSSDPYVPEVAPMQREPEIAEYKDGLTLQDNPLAGTPLEAIPDVSERPRRSPAKQPQQSRLNKPFVPPLENQPPRERVWFDHLENVERRPAPHPRPQNKDHAVVVQGELGDLTEDARPLTPPRRNRDIREFVGGRGDGSLAALIEARNYPQAPTAGTDVGQENQVIDEISNLESVHPSRRGFVRASEIATLNDDSASPEKHTVTPPKRRKSSSRRALQQLTSNGPLPQQADEDPEYRPTTHIRTPSRRRSLHKPPRTKSSKLPLERTPAGQGTHNLLHNVPVSMNMISRLAGKIDKERSLLGFNQPAIGFEDVFTSDPPSLEGLTGSLRELLVRAGGSIVEEEMLREVEGAFARHAAAADGAQEEDEMMSSI